jgi:hypothetical protein
VPLIRGNGGGRRGGLCRLLRGRDWRLAVLRLIVAAQLRALVVTVLLGRLVALGLFRRRVFLRLLRGRRLRCIGMCGIRLRRFGLRCRGLLRMFDFLLVRCRFVLARVVALIAGCCRWRSGLGDDECLVETCG